MKVISIKKGVDLTSFSTEGPRKPLNEKKSKPTPPFATKVEIGL